MEIYSTKVKVILGLTLLVKIITLTIFSSDYLDKLFVPFVSLFLENQSNPWAMVTANQLPLEFPYPPLMLYLLSFFYFPVYLFGLENTLWTNLFLGLPILLSDLLIFLLLAKQFPWRKTEIYSFYFVSPIIFFSSFIHHQLDIIPTCLFFLGTYYLARKQYLACISAIAIAVSVKFHVVAILPLLVIYFLNKSLYKEAILSLVLPAALYLILAAPFLFDPAYIAMVLQNQKQQLMFDTFYQLGEIKIYLPLLSAAIIYIHFLAYKKINIDLFFAFVGTLFASFLLLIVPSPGWYVWVVPFLTIFFIRYFDGLEAYYFYLLVSGLYLSYFVFFHRYEYQPINFLQQPLDLSLANYTHLRDINFTLLAAALFMVVVLFYLNAARSNQIYKKRQAFVIGISGDSGTGKSTLLNDISALMGRMLQKMEGDGNHRWERGDENWKTFTHLDPKANYLHQQSLQIARLKSGSRISRYDYDHDTGKFTQETILQPKDFLIIAGLHPFYLPKMRQLIDLKIFLDPEEGLRQHWKINRDTSHRQQSKDKILASINARKADGEKYIQPQKQFADLVIHFFEKDPLGLQLTLNASLHIEEIVNYFQSHGIQPSWDYSQDLNSQYLKFEQEPIQINFNQMAQQFIPNTDELIDQSNWLTGYRGLLQFTVLFVISNIMQEKRNHQD